MKKLYLQCTNILLTPHKRIEMSRDMTKPTKLSVGPGKTQISLGIRPVWSKSSLSAWRNSGSLATHWAHSEDSDQTGRMPTVISVFAVRTLILLVLICRGSNQLQIRITNIQSVSLHLKWMRWQSLIIVHCFFSRRNLEQYKLEHILHFRDFNNMCNGDKLKKKNTFKYFAEGQSSNNSR